MLEKLKTLLGMGKTGANAAFGSSPEMAKSMSEMPAKRPSGVSFRQLPAAARKVKLQYQFAFATEQQIGDGSHSDKTGTEYQIHGRNYADTSSLEAEKITEYTKDIVWFQDTYGYPVLALYESVPVSEPADREWDGLHVLYLVYDGTDIFGLYCVRGYRIAALTLYDQLLYAERSVREFFDDMGFPMDRLDALDADDPERFN